MSELSEADKNIEVWKVKKLIKSLEAARGNGTSMISLIIPPKDQISRVSKMLADEYGTASNIKSRVNRLSVLAAITSTQQRLKLYNKVPNNGLIVYCGTIVTDEGKEKKVNIDFEPFKPINTSLYLCVAGDAVVATASGAGRRLHDVVACAHPERVLAASPDRRALAVAPVTAFQHKGTRACVTVTLRDGRTLTCTPDHRVLVRRASAPVWIEAADLLQTDLAVCGLDAPLVDDDADAGNSAWAIAGIPAGDRARLLAFARVCGLVAAGDAFPALRVDHELDVASVQDDIALVCGTSGVVRAAAATGVHEVALPPALQAMCVAAGAAARPAWPAWALDAQTPLSVLREFIGGAMGGCGLAPRLGDGGWLEHEVVFAQPARGVRGAEQLCQMLERLGVQGVSVREDAAVCLPSTHGSLAFDTSVGYRHSVRKQALNSAAAVYRRLREQHAAQREAFAALVAEARSAGESRAVAAKKARLAMRERHGAMVSPGPFAPFERVLREIGALSLFTAGLPCGSELPPLLLGVRDVRAAGEREVFDISVEAAHSFTANGVVVHNCDNKFHTEALQELMASDSKFGFIVMDGNGSLFGTLSGNTREVLHKFAVDLPKKHGRGGQSALRFARLRTEKRHNYVRKVAELATQFFITNDRPNISGLILAGSADFKTELGQSDMFDPRLQEKIIKVIDVSYGGENGFNQAIELSQDALTDVKFIQEKKLIQTYFDQISQDTGRYCFGVADTFKALDMGAVETLIVWENLDVMRYVVKNNTTAEEKVVLLTKEQEATQNQFKAGEDGGETEVVDKQLLMEWLAENYKNFGATLEFVTNRSQEGAQFVKGFGGIGGLLRYKVDFEQLEEADANDDDDFYESD